MKAAKRKSDEQAENSRKPIAGKDSVSAVGEIFAERGASLVTGEDEEAGDREKAFDGKVGVQHAEDDEEGAARTEVGTMDEHDNCREKEPNDIKVVITHQEAGFRRRDIRQLSCCSEQIQDTQCPTSAQLIGQSPARASAGDSPI